MYNLEEHYYALCGSAVASMHYTLCYYRTHIVAHESRQEEVGNLKDIIKNMILHNNKEAGSHPERIIIFRDGIADSSFDATFNTEIASIKDSFAGIEKGYSPEVNYVITQKRHSVRFGTASHENLQPGTFVSDVCNNNGLDFFLVSSNALHGTAKPTRYKFILNESNFTRETIYKEIYGMCHLYARATKAVSVVPAIYYAHLACQRGKAYLEKDKSGKVTLKPLITEFEKCLFYI